MASMAHYLLMAVVAASICSHFVLADTEETESLRTLLSGLRATTRILQLAILPTADVSRGSLYDFWDMLHALLQINTYGEELDSLLTLPEHQNSSELVALQTVTKILIENSCDLMTLKLDNFNCTSVELKQLHLEVDAYVISRETNNEVLSYRNDVGGIDDRGWIETHVKCESSEATLEIFNKAFGENSFSLEGCM